MDEEDIVYLIERIVEVVWEVMKVVWKIVKFTIRGLIWMICDKKNIKYKGIR